MGGVLCLWKVSKMTFKMNSEQDCQIWKIEIQDTQLSLNFREMINNILMYMHVFHVKFYSTFSLATLTLEELRGVIPYRLKIGTRTWGAGCGEELLRCGTECLGLRGRGIEDRVPRLKFCPSCLLVMWPPCQLTELLCIWKTGMIIVPYLIKPTQRLK
jgi:hypothetical protein